MPKRGRWRAIAAILVCGIGAACTSTPPPTTALESWAPRAQQYMAAFHEAQGVGFTNLAPFYAPNAHVDFGLLDFDGSGRPGIIQAMRDTAQSPPVSFGGRDPADTSQIAFDEPPYVSADGAVDVARLTPAGYTIPFTSAYKFGPDGIGSEIWAGSLAAGQEYINLDRAPLERIARGYLDAWASGDSHDVAALYDAEAQVGDSFTGLRLLGSDRIGAAATRPWADGGLRGAVLREIPQGGGPAVYVNAESTGSGPIDRMVLLLHVDPGDGCPGEVAVVLHLGSVTILSEERYHRIDSPDACWGSNPSGWWDDVRIPDPPAVLRTGSMTVNGLEVAIWNGADDSSRLIQWALQRFADAGLPAPIPTSVTFLPEGDDPWLDFGFEEGTTAPDLAVAFPASAACVDSACTRWPTAAKAAMLHQLAHLYLADPAYPRWEDPLTGPTRMAPYRTVHDLAWLDAARPWAEQAAQLAAETVTWGLMDEPYAVDARMGAPSCSTLADDFAGLTWSTPDPRSCADGSRDPDEPWSAPARPPLSPAPQPTATTAPTGPAAAAERWFVAYDAALDRGILDLYGYYATNATFDHRALGMNVISGRDALREHLTTMAWAPLLERAPLEPLLVSASGAITVMALPGSAKAAFLVSLAPTGITSETYAPSLVTLRSAHPGDERLALLQQFAESYLAAWVNGDRPAVTGLYATGARLRDELLDVTATGIDEVRALARAVPARGGLHEATLVSLPDLGGPAVFATGGADPGDPVDTVMLLMTVDRACPSLVATVLRLDIEGHITEESRHHSTTALGGCIVPDPRAALWWEGLAIPPGVSVAHSGMLTVADHTIEVRDSSPALDRLLAWGVQRFEAAGLVPPVVSTVTFVDRKAPACSGINGLAAGADISLCFGTSDICTDDSCTGWRPWAKKALIHEFSHVWMSQNVTWQTRDEFLSAAGLSAWESSDVLWGQRGVELAAETMAGSLMDERVPLNVKLQHHYSSAELTTLFEVITGAPV